VDGYYDYDPQLRGVLFAPVYFRRSFFGFFGWPRYRYCPSICIDVGNLFASLFCRPQYGHYYFGDYYDPGYSQYGIYPWFETPRVHRWYSPFCEYTAWRHEREQPHWMESVRRDFDDRRVHRELRPAHTFRALEAEIQRRPDSRLTFAKPLTAFAVSSKGTFQFERVNDEARQRMLQQGRDRRDLASQRARWESDSARRGKALKPSRVILPATARTATPPASTSQPVTPQRSQAEGGAPRASGGAPTTGGFPSGKRDSDRQTRIRREPTPAPPVPATAAQQQTQAEGGAPRASGGAPTPGGAPAGKRDHERDTKSQQQPPPPSDQTDDKHKDDSKGRHKGDSKD
jgi:hypothetical protein